LLGSIIEYVGKNLLTNYGGKNPERNIKEKEVLPPWPRARIMVPQSYSVSKVTRLARFGE